MIDFPSKNTYEYKCSLVRKNRNKHLWDSERKRTLLPVC